MARVRIQNLNPEQCSKVPIALWDTKMSFKAKGLYAYLCSFDGEPTPTAAQIETTLQIGKSSRQAAMREIKRLEQTGWTEQ